MQQKVTKEPNRTQKVGLADPTATDQHRNRRQVRADVSDALEVPYRDVLDHYAARSSVSSSLNERKVWVDASAGANCRHVSHAARFIMFSTGFKTWRCGHARPEHPLPPTQTLLPPALASIGAFWIPF